MIKKHHTHIVLLTLFFTGLIVLWWAGPTEKEKEQMRTRVVPELMNLPLDEVHRVEVENGHGSYVFERGKGGRWQMKRPADVAADSAVVARLVNGIKELRRSPDAGTIKGAPATFGLEPPAATVRLFGSEPETLLAALEIGKPVALEGAKAAEPATSDRRYARPIAKDGTKEGIELIDGKPVAAVEDDTYDWREKALLSVPTFSVTDLTVVGPGRDLEARRVEGHWVLKKPIRALANDDQVEGALAELTSLRVAEGKNGYAADDVRDFAPYGLDKPLMTVTLTSSLEKGKPLVLDIGAPVPGKPDLFFARRGDQNDVVWIDGKELRDLGTDVNELRSKKVADVEPGRVTFIALQAHGQNFRIARTTGGWVLIGPKRERADQEGVQNLLAHLGKLQALEFLEASKVTSPRLDPPLMTVKVWQGQAGTRIPAEPPAAPEGEPALDLKIGRHATLKAVYAQVEGDPKTVLALPDQILDALPKNALAFRDRAVLALSPASIARLTVHRDARTYDLRAPDSAGNPNEWKLVAPVSAPADPEAVTQLTTLLAHLSAESFITDQPGADKEYGLDHPVITLTWEERPEARLKGQEKDQSGTLRVGAPVPKSDERYARIDGNPLVFTLDPMTLQVFRAEFRDHKVLTFPPPAVSRVTLRWPDRTLRFLPKAGRGALSTWRPEAGEDISGFDLSLLSALVPSLANLRTQEFAQYQGIFPQSMGLDQPRLEIEVLLSGSLGTKVLRIGNPTRDGPLYATTETGSAGVVFTLAGPSWVELARVPQKQYPDLPENVFTPEPQAGGARP